MGNKNNSSGLMRVQSLAEDNDNILEFYIYRMDT